MPHFLWNIESERHAYLSVILQQLGNEVGFFQQKGEIETGNNWVTSCWVGNLYGVVRPENDNRRFRYRTHIFFDFKYNLGIVVTIVMK